VSRSSTVAGDSLAIWAVVPVKALGGAKSRLASVLDAAQRRALAAAMLRHTLDILRACRGLEGILVISVDGLPAVVELGRDVLFVPEEKPTGLNSSLAQASAAVLGRGGDGVLVIPGDLPLLTCDSVAALLALATPRGVVVAPDRHEQGTNALLVTPPDVIPFRFGPGSLQRHLAGAVNAGCVPIVHRSRELAFDVDTSRDLAQLRDFSPLTRY